MRRYHSWLAALGIAAATPGLALAGPFSLFSGDREARPASGSDAKAANEKQANDVAKALRSARLVGYDIQVECRNGEATLIGEVPTAQQRALASKATEAVPGIRKVNNQLSVKQSAQQARSNAPAKPAAETAARQAPARRQPIQQVQFEEGGVAQNQEKADQIAEALRTAKFVGENVEIQFQDGVASISGTVANAQRRSSATSIISRIPGVKQVDNQLEVQQPTVARAPAVRPANRQPIRQVQFDEAQAAQAPQSAGGPPMGQMGIPPTGGPGGAGYPAYPQGPYPQGPYPQGAGPVPVNGMPMAASNPVMYDQPNLPEHAWPAYASYPNYAAVSYPKQYSASAWPYIGPFYPYPQVPLGWRKVQLEWDDGYWQLNFRPRTDRWWWFLNYQNW